MMSSRSLTSSPIRCSALRQHGQAMIVDVDHHLDARQMRRQRSAVHAARGGAACPLGRRGRFALGLALAAACSTSSSPSSN